MRLNGWEEERLDCVSEQLWGQARKKEVTGEGDSDREERKGRKDERVKGGGADVGTEGGKEEDEEEEEAMQC